MIYDSPDVYLSQHEDFLLSIYVFDYLRTLTAMKYLETSRNIIAGLVNMHWICYALISSKLAEALWVKNVSNTICK
jgi:hypothetical protein